MSDKPRPVPQEHYDQERERFDAETFKFDMKQLKDRCDHYFVRRTATTVECQNCPAGWQDMGKFKIKDGKVEAIS